LKIRLNYIWTRIISKKRFLHKLIIFTLQNLIYCYIILAFYQIITRFLFLFRIVSPMFIQLRSSRPRVQCTVDFITTWPLSKFSSRYLFGLLKPHEFNVFPTYDYFIVTSILNFAAIQLNSDLLT